MRDNSTSGFKNLDLPVTIPTGNTTFGGSLDTMRMASVNLQTTGSLISEVITPQSLFFPRVVT
jgi:hypothetical protein